MTSNENKKKQGLFMPWPMRCTFALQWYKGVQGYCILPNMQYILK